MIKPISLLLFASLIFAVSASAGNQRKPDPPFPLANVHGHIRLVNMEMMCVRDHPNCNAYSNSPVIFCAPLRGFMPVSNPCAAPTMQTQTDENGFYSLKLPAGSYYVYLKKASSWVLKAVSVKPGDNPLNLVVNESLSIKTLDPR